MDIRFLTKHGQIGLSVNGSQPLLVGSHVEGRTAAVLGWTGKTKGLSERFFVLIALLAVARKLPEEVRRCLSVSCDDQGAISLSELRKLSPFCGPRSVDNLKTDICNHFARASGDKPSLLSILPISRGSHEKDLLSLTCDSENIHLDSAQQLVIWIQQYREHSQPSLGTVSARTPRPPLPDWQATREGGEVGFFPFRPIENPRFFFGRGREVRTVLGWLSRIPMHNAAILGSRLSGKTSFLRQICHIIDCAKLRPDQQTELPTFIPKLKHVYVDFEIPQLLRQSCLLSHILNSLGAPIEDPLDLDHFMSSMANSIQAPTVLILDNIDTCMRENTDKNDSDALTNIFWDCMRALVSNYTNGNLSFLIAARETPEKLAERYHYSSSFFNIFRPVWLGPLEPEAAGALVDNSPIPWLPEDKAFILQLSEGWPGLLQLACDLGLEARRRPANDPDWKTAAEEELGRLRRKATEGS